MAFAYARLTEINYIADAAAAEYTNPASTTTYVRSIILHNTHSSDLAVTLYNVPDNSEAVGTAAVANQFYKETIAANDTLMLEFPAPGLVLTDTNDTIQAVCGTADKVTIQIFGGTE